MRKPYYKQISSYLDIAVYNFKAVAFSELL